MKYVICSDVHANLQALTAFLAIVDGSVLAEAPLLCLGDTVGYGANPSECLATMKKRCRAMIAGNHERMLLDAREREKANHAARRAIEMTAVLLTPAEMELAGGLPNSETVNDTGGPFLLVHGAPQDPDAYILGPRDGLSAIADLKAGGYSTGFFGHTHVPCVCDEKGYFYYEANREIELTHGAAFLVNPGSVGQPRDGNPGGSFCVFDSVRRSVQFFRFEYDIRESARQIKTRGFPEELGLRLFYGM